MVDEGVAVRARSLLARAYFAKNSSVLSCAHWLTGAVMRDNDEGVAFKRWTSHRHRPRKDVPRTYEHLSDEALTDQLRQSTQTLAILMRLNQRCFDTQPEALRIRALTVEERKILREQTLAAATRIRDEFRRRTTLPGASAK
jgi:hypothetical protein